MPFSPDALFMVALALLFILPPLIIHVMQERGDARRKPPMAE